MSALGEVIPSLKLWANQYLNFIGPSGSLAKGTAVAGRTDVDVFISIKNASHLFRILPPTDRRSTIPSRSRSLHLEVAWCLRDSPELLGDQVAI